MFDEAERELEALAVESRHQAGVKEKQVLLTRVEGVVAGVSCLSQMLVDMERDPGAQGIGTDELRRRQGLLSNLQLFLENVRELVSRRSDSARGALFGVASSEGRGDVSRGGSETLSNEELLMQSRRQIEDQDEKLDLIGEGLSRLKGMGYEINSELDLHASLLGEIDVAVDRADTNMRANIRGIETVHRSSTESCCPLGIMALLLAVIVILVGVELPCVPCG